jgi:hypothetical protein
MLSQAAKEKSMTKAAKLDSEKDNCPGPNVIKLFAIVIY